VIVSSYNQSRALRLVLTGFAAQSRTDFELLIADDGSEESILRVVEEFESHAPFPVRFLTQPDYGFRKARILNDAIVASRGEQLVFCDGDCVPLRNFISVHRAHYYPGTFCAGGRVALSAEQSRELSCEAVATGAHQRLLTSRWRRRLRWVHWKNVLYRYVGKRYKPKILGCNWSADREVLMRVDGFDERYSQFGGEDSDIRNRLRNLSATGISLWNSAFVLHLDHSLDPQRYARTGPRLRKDREVYEAGRNRVKARKGISSRAATTAVEEPLDED